MTIDEYVRAVAMNDEEDEYFVGSSLPPDVLIDLLHDALGQAGWCLWHCGTRHFHREGV